MINEYLFYAESDSALMDEGFKAPDIIRQN